MRFNHHSSRHWLVVAVVAIVALFTFGHARGQGPGASAAFEGRPALAGAQGGLGAQAGMPLGGVGVQGNETALRKKSDVAVPPKKNEVATDLRSPSRKVKKAAKRSLERSRTGVGGIDAGAIGPN